MTPTKTAPTPTDNAFAQLQEAKQALAAPAQRLGQLQMQLQAADAELAALEGERAEAIKQSALDGTAKSDVISRLRVKSTAAQAKRDDIAAMIPHAQSAVDELQPAVDAANAAVKAAHGDAKYAELEDIVNAINPLLREVERLWASGIAVTEECRLLTGSQPDFFYRANSELQKAWIFGGGGTCPRFPTVGQRRNL